MIDLSSRLASGDTLYGTFLGLGSALAAEACALAGFDWLLTDLEHGGGDESELLHQQLAADAHAVPMLVRVESTHRIRAGHALDLGAAGIMFPGIESAAQATRAIRHVYYPPDGDSGVATYNRAYGFGLHPERLETVRRWATPHAEPVLEVRRGVSGRRSSLVDIEAEPPSGTYAAAANGEALVDPAALTPLDARYMGRRRRFIRFFRSPRPVVAGPPVVVAG